MCISSRPISILLVLLLLPLIISLVLLVEHTVDADEDDDAGAVFGSLSGRCGRQIHYCPHERGEGLIEDLVVVGVDHRGVQGEGSVVACHGQPALSLYLVEVVWLFASVNVSIFA